MANKTVVSIDDIIAKYRSEFDKAYKDVHDLVDNISFDSSNVFDLHFDDDLRRRVDLLTSDLSGMLYLIYLFSRDDDFFEAESVRVRSLRYDTICDFIDRKIAYIHELQEGANEACHS